MKYLTLALIGLMMATNAHQISSVERNGSWIYMYDEHGKKYSLVLSLMVASYVMPRHLRGSGRSSSGARVSSSVLPSRWTTTLRSLCMSVLRM